MRLPKLKFAVEPELIMRFREACNAMHTPQADAIRMLVATFTEMVESGELTLPEVTEARRELAEQQMGGKWRRGR